jgi:hypothetical protein
MSQASKAAWGRSWRRLLILSSVLLAMTLALAISLSRRADHLWQRSQEHLKLAVMYLQVVDAFDRLHSRNAKQESLRQQFQARFDYHVDLSVRYEEAMWRPWRTVEEGQSP